MYQQLIYRPFLQSLTKLVAIIIFAISLVYTGDIAVWAQPAKLPRTIIALYDRDFEGDPRFTRIHKFLEMPLNHLGYVVKYYNIREPLPEITSDVKGAVIWFSVDTQLEDISWWLDWLHNLLDNKKKLLLIGRLGVADKLRDTDPEIIKQINKLLNRIGVRDNNNWINLTYDVKVLHRDKRVVDFERNYGGLFPPYISTTIFDKRAVSHLRLEAPQFEHETSDLVITHPNGGYIARNYAVYLQETNNGEDYFGQWFINPFRFLRMVFDADNQPKPDVTTLNGKRIFYSHIDGDGWNNLAELEKYKNTGVLAAEVLYNEILKPYSHLPFTVGFVVSELEVSCQGTPQSKDIARKILALPNIEAGSHTHSHPLLWSYFADGAYDEQERFGDKYPGRLYKRFFLSMLFDGEATDLATKIFQKEYKPYTPDPNRDPFIGIKSAYVTEEEKLRDYKLPRSYACEPFSLEREIGGSVEYINALSNGKKKVKLYQWSGNTVPFEAAIAETRKQGLYNINGGDSRFDSEFPSYTSVSGIGVQVGNERQIYSSNSNENTYTNLWTGRFFGFRYLRTTVANTETPVRVDPFNVYFHVYSAQKQASLNAVLENLNYAEEQDIIPIFTSEFAAIANSFYNVDFVKLGDNSWKILNRGAVQTIRFDKATLQTVNFNKSKGVLGQFHYQGSLYVALDPEYDTPIISLKNKANIAGYDYATRPYLIKSNWKIKDLHIGKDMLSFAASGFGAGSIVWKMPQCGDYIVQIQNAEEEVTKYKGITTHDCILEVAVPSSEYPLSIMVNKAK